MASSINLKNSGGSTLAITHSDSKSGKTIVGTDIVTSVATINDFPTVGIQDGDTVIVKEEGRGGVFIYDGSLAPFTNQGTNFSGWIRQYSGVVNVKWFGANSTREDNQATINYMLTQFDSIVFAQGCTYKINDAIVVRGSNKTIDLNGATIEALDTGIAFFSVTCRHENASSTEEDFVNRLSNITITNGTITSFGTAITTRNCDNVIASNLNIASYLNGIDIEMGKHIKVIDNTIVSQTTYGINIYRTFLYTLERNNITANGSVSGVGVVLKGTYSDYLNNGLVANNAIYSHVYGIAAGAGLEESNSSNVLISENRIFNLTGNTNFVSVRLRERTDAFTITGNFLYSGGRIILYSGNHIISENRIYGVVGNTYNAITSYSNTENTTDNIKILSNTIMDSTAHAISLQGSYCIVDGNTIINTANNCVYLSLASNNANTVSNNIMTTASNGVYEVSGVSNTIANGNIIQNTTTPLSLYGGNVFSTNGSIAYGNVTDDNDTSMPYGQEFKTSRILKLFNTKIIPLGTAPTVGTWAIGDMVINTGATAGGYAGWICTTAGVDSAAVWKTFGAISA